MIPNCCPSLPIRRISLSLTWEFTWSSLIVVSSCNKKSVANRFTTPTKNAPFQAKVQYRMTDALLSVRWETVISALLRELLYQIYLFVSTDFTVFFAVSAMFLKKVRNKTFPKNVGANCLFACCQDSLVQTYYESILQILFNASEIF